MADKLITDASHILLNQGFDFYVKTRYVTQRHADYLLFFMIYFSHDIMLLFITNIVYFVELPPGPTECVVMLHTTKANTVKNDGIPIAT